VPELYAAALGTLKAGLVFTPLFSAFGPEPIRTRMEIGERQCAGDHRVHLQAQDRAWRDEIPR
jgi:acetyl-CoA synthetase